MRKSGELTTANGHSESKIADQDYANACCETSMAKVGLSTYNGHSYMPKRWMKATATTRAATIVASVMLAHFPLPATAVILFSKLLPSSV